MTRIAVVGYGLVGKRHVEAIGGASGVTLSAIVEPQDAARAQQAGVAVMAALDELLDRAAPDGVVLATPTPLHAEQALMCIDRGCPVLIEKPIAVTAEEGRAIAEASRKTGVPVLVGHHRRHNGIVQAAKAALGSGEIGSIRAVQATCWLHKPESYFDVAPWRKRAGAGPVSVNLIHDIDLLRHFCGDVASVVAHAAPSRRGYENEDVAGALLTFESGAVATVSVSDTIASPWSWEFTSGENPAYPNMPESCYLIGGDAGSLSIPDLRIWRHEGAPDWWSPMTATALDAVAGDPLAEQLSHFGRVIRGEVLPLVSAEEGLRSLQVIEAIQKSAAMGHLSVIKSLTGDLQA